MHTHVYSMLLHAQVARHLRGEFASATLTVQDGQTLDLITVGNFVQGGMITGELFGSEPCAFDPTQIRDVTLTVLDPRMMAPSELVALGLVLPAEPVKKAREAVA